MTGIITVTQHVGSEEYLVHYYLKENDQCVMDRYLVKDGSTEMVNSYTLSGGAKALTDLILVCLLENNSGEDYRASISLRTAANMEHVRDMTNCLEKLMSAGHDDEFDCLVQTYDKIKDSYYAGIVCSYSFVGLTYDEFYEQSNVMCSTIERMVSLLSCL